MHGIIHSELKKFVVAKHGLGAWTQLLATSGLSGKTYLANGVYPDCDAHAIIGAASRMTGASADVILEDFGRFITPNLMSIYAALIRPEWRTIDMLLNTESVIHSVVRIKNPGAAPPRLQFERTGPNALRFIYVSGRKMSAVAKGIMRGVADHFGERIAITEKARPDGSVEMNVMVA